MVIRPENQHMRAHQVEYQIAKILGVPAIARRPRFLEARLAAGEPSAAQMQQLSRLVTLSRFSRIFWITN
mgnify:CR=1 FL=1